MQINPEHFRARNGAVVTLENVEELLDGGMIEVKMRGDRWWKLRRNGMTKRWKKSERFRIPTKAGMYSYGEITERDFR